MATGSQERSLPREGVVSKPPDADTNTTGRSASGQAESAAKPPAPSAAAPTVARTQKEAIDEVGLPPFCRHSSGTRRWQSRTKT